MVLEKLGNSLRETLQKITKSAFFSDNLLNELVKDIQRALLQADVNVKLVFELTTNIKNKAKSDKLPAGLSKKEHLVNIVYEELTSFLGGEFNPIKIQTTKKPFKIMLTGLFGSGKTTTAGKLAKYYVKRGFKVATVQTDTWRPAAFQQLKTNSEQAGVDFFGINPDPSRKNDLTYPSEIYNSFLKEYIKYDILIIDTAGRDALNEDLIDELKNINNSVSPDETLLVMSADVGQTAEKQATAFHENCKVTGVIVTKMDGTAKAGGALSACSITKTNVKFIGIGEKIDDFEEFKPENFVSRLLGMGDLEALLEKAKSAINMDNAEDLGKRMLEGNFTLNDLYEQMSAMRKMGPLAKVMDLIPGMGGLNIPKEALKEQEKNLDKWKYVMDSCTKEELANPDLIKISRMERIARGSGRDIQDIRNLLKQYAQSKKMMKMLKGGTGGNPKNMEKMMKRMGGLKGLNLGNFK